MVANTGSFSWLLKPYFTDRNHKISCLSCFFIFVQHESLPALLAETECKMPSELVKEKVSPANSMGGGVWDQGKDGSINLLTYLHCCGLANMGNYICKGAAVWVSRCANRKHMSALELKAVSYLRLTYIWDSKTVNTFVIVCYCKSILTGILSKHTVLDFSIFRHWSTDVHLSASCSEYVFSLTHFSQMAQEGINDKGTRLLLEGRLYHA